MTPRCYGMTCPNSTEALYGIVLVQNYRADKSKIFSCKYFHIDYRLLTVYLKSFQVMISQGFQFSSEHAHRIA